MNTTTLTPRLVPDAIREVSSLIQAEVFKWPAVNSVTPRVMELCQRLDLIAREIDAPRLVPDRPSDAALAKAFWNAWDAATSLKLPAASTYLGAIIAEARAAAPPAEAPAERGDFVRVPREMTDAMREAVTGHDDVDDAWHAALAAAPAGATDERGRPMTYWGGKAATAGEAVPMTETSRVPDDFRNCANAYRCGWNDRHAAAPAEPAEGDDLSGFKRFADEAAIALRVLANKPEYANTEDRRSYDWLASQADKLCKAIATAPRVTGGREEAGDA